VPPSDVIQSILAVALVILPLTGGFRLLSADPIRLRSWRHAIHPLLPIKEKAFIRSVRASGVILIVFSLAMAGIVISPFFTNA
jgi:hypothetical protein